MSTAKHMTDDVVISVKKYKYAQLDRVGGRGGKVIYFLELYNI